MRRAIHILFLLGSALTVMQCGKLQNCTCEPTLEARFVDYSNAEENEQYKICFQNSEAFTKDGVFYYTNPSRYRVYDCWKGQEIRINNNGLNDGYSSTLYVDDGTLFVNHYRSRELNKKYCGKSVEDGCTFWITHKAKYNSNGQVDTTHQLFYPQVSEATIKAYRASFESALKKAKTNRNFEEDPVYPKGFDYYGHAEDLLVGALNGDTTCEARFRGYKELTETIISKKVYSFYADTLDKKADKEFFVSGIDMLNETNQYKKKYWK